VLRHIKKWQGYTEPDESTPVTHTAELDALRGVAILGVVLCHILVYWTLLGVPLMVPLLGVDATGLYIGFSKGLYLFFVLSGYLLTWTEEKRVRKGTYSVGSYAWRRILRLVPAYYVTIPIALLLWPISASAWDVLLHAFFLHGLSPEASIALDPAWWSLTVEVIFYLMLPLIVLKLPGLRQRLLLLGVAFLMYVATRLYIVSNLEELSAAQPGSVTPYFLSILPTSSLFFFLTVSF
jgi:peptidoglycan/LPS O-acetylase OafA/YrhL